MSTNNQQETALLEIIQQRGRLKNNTPLSVSSIREAYWHKRNSLLLDAVMLPSLLRGYTLAKYLMPSCNDVFSTALIEGIEQIIVLDERLEFAIQETVSHWLEYYYYPAHPEWDWPDPSNEEIISVYNQLYPKIQLTLF